MYTICARQQPRNLWRTTGRTLMSRKSALIYSLCLTTGGLNTSAANAAIASAASESNNPKLSKILNSTCLLNKIMATNSDHVLLNVGGRTFLASKATLNNTENGENGNSFFSRFFKGLFVIIS